MAQVWAVEIVAGGKLTRFERDSASNWFRHTGQHSHAANANAHLADPMQARIIAAALDAFDATAVETRLGRTTDAGHLAKFGLSFPPVIVLLYARDNSTELARIEFGGAADGLDRYARLAPDGEVVTVAEFERQAAYRSAQGRRGGLVIGLPVIPAHLRSRPFCFLHCDWCNGASPSGQSLDCPRELWQIAVSP